MEKVMQQISTKQYFALAIPLIISTITTPLLGIVDTMVVGHLKEASYIAGVAIGTMIFNTLYWLFGFLRIGTTGLIAQADGKKNEKEQLLAFWRPLLFALIVGIVFVLGQIGILQASFWLTQPDATVQAYVTEYFEIRIWGAPFALMMYVLLGWLIGMKKVKVTLLSQVYMNVLNMILCIVFVMYVGMDVQGVALATVIAEISAPLILLVYMKHFDLYSKVKSVKQELLQLSSFVHIMAMNRDFFIRTICLLIAFALFTAKGTEMGVEYLAANTILFQIHFMFAYFFDGLANASSIYVGNAVGANNYALYKKTIRISFYSSLTISIVLSFCFFIEREWILSAFTNIEDVLELAIVYSPWLTLFPLVSFWGLMLNGIFAGATFVTPIRNSMIQSFLLFVCIIYIAMPLMHNHGLWLAFILFSFGRSFFLARYQKKLQTLFT